MVRKAAFRSLSFDVLESRTLPAGNVTASIMGGTLVVRGDDLDNRITVDQRGLAGGQVRLTGAAGTAVNGQAGPVILAGLTRNVRVVLDGGDDRLTVANLNAPRDLVIDAGVGDDAVVLRDVTVGRHLVVQTRAGDDVLALRGAVQGQTRISTDGGADRVGLYGVQFRGDVRLQTGRGGDRIMLSSASFQGRRHIDPGPGDDTVTGTPLTRRFDFRQGTQGWGAGFSDYPPGQEQFYELQAGLRPLPPDLGVSGTGFYLQGNNHSDDLFMFLKRRLGPTAGVRANQTYQVQFTIQFASNAPSGAFGIGGAPGESVYLKAGATPTEPQAVRDPAEPDRLRLNVDKGEQSTGGTAASVVGNIANGVPAEQVGDDPPYVSLTRTHTHTALVTANSRGELWLLVGTDSGFEGTTALYYQQINVTLTPVTRR